MKMVALAASMLALLVSAAATGLKLRAGPAPAPAAVPAPAPAPAPPPIRPGIVVQVTKSKEQLQKDFAALKDVAYYVPLMDEMLGKTFVVKEMNHGGAGVASPNGSQDDVWFFPVASLTPWLETPAGKEVPIAGRAFKAVGLPTRTQVDIGHPGRHDAPWEYTIKGRNLMDPIAPPYNERVDLDKGQPLPPWRKVRQVVSVECMEKMHKDPSVLCKPEAYKDYNLVTPAPVPEKPLTQAEAKVLKTKIKNMQTTIDNLTPKEAKKVKMRFEAPGMKKSDSTLVTAGEESNSPPTKSETGSKMKIGKEASEERLSTAQGHGEKSL